MVSTLDFESSDPSSNLGGTWLTPWRNGSASDSRSEGCVFESRRGQYNFYISFFQNCSLLLSQKLIQNLFLPFRKIRGCSRSRLSSYTTFAAGNSFLQGFPPKFWKFSWWTNVYVLLWPLLLALSFFSASFLPLMLLLTATVLSMSWSSCSSSKWRWSRVGGSWRSPETSCLVTDTGMELWLWRMDKFSS